MNQRKWIKDSFIYGMVSGLISLTVFYFLLTWLRTLLIGYFGNPYMLRPPVVQLITMLINIILFRVLMINLEKEKTAKGFLFITVIATLIYFFILFKLNK